MINPHWAHALTTSSVRRRVNLFLDGVRITLELIGDTTVGIVRTKHVGRDLRPNDVIWVKAMAPDGVTIREYQFFAEGIAGVIRALERIALVEEAKGKALARGATELTTNLSDLLEAANDKELGSSFKPHLALIELFINGRPETADRLKCENPRKVRAMLQRCLTLRDITGRPNPYSKVLGVKSATKRLRAMSARRMATANTALTTSITLDALMQAMHALVVEVNEEVTSKLNADTWNMHNTVHQRWMRQFATRLMAWANEFGNMDMHPFNHSATQARLHLGHAALMIQGPMIAHNINAIMGELRKVLTCTKVLLARFLVAETLRLVGTARDERVKKLGLTVEPPVWNQIGAVLQETRATFGMQEPIGVPNATQENDVLPEFFYRALRETAEFHDTASRNAA